MSVISGQSITEEVGELYLRFSFPPFSSPHFPIHFPFPSSPLFSTLRSRPLRHN